jgi:hypothetical protein
LDARTPVARKYGILVMVLIEVALTVGLALALYKIADNNRKICTAIETLSSALVIRPADPVEDLAQEALWKEYVATVKLKEKLGCTS